MKIVFLTAGAAGMYCGSCMHDNALAKALRSEGADCLLQPLYTPLRTDEPNIASEEVFFGGVHIYLLQKFPWLHWVPQALRRWLDNPRFLRWATKRSSSTNAASLGELALAMLRGEDGAVRDEVTRMVTWLRDEMKPDVIVFSNLLIGGSLPALRRELPDTKMVVILQGDDAFLDYLPGKYESLAIKELARLSQYCDGIITNSQFYANKMAHRLSLPTARIHVVPLSIDVEPFRTLQRSSRNSSPRIGYLARISPEKGLHHLVDAIIELSKRSTVPPCQLVVAGWLGNQHRGYLSQLEGKLAAEGLLERFEYVGSPDLAGKLTMLSGLDVLSVPTEHEEPKGLFVLESLAAGVPVVQPASGAFPELIESTGGGLLVRPRDPVALADGIEALLKDATRREQMGSSAREAVLQRHNTRTQAQTLLTLFRAITPHRLDSHHVSR